MRKCKKIKYMLNEQKVKNHMKVWESMFNVVNVLILKFLTNLSFSGLNFS